MRVGILGAGAIGTLFGASFAPDVEVRVLARDNRRARAVASRGGLVLDGAPPRFVVAGATPDVFNGVDVVLVAVKTYDTVEALLPLRGTKAAGAIFVSVQNGAESLAHLEFALGHRCCVALGPTTEGVASLEAGVARRTGIGRTHLGWARNHRGDDGLLDGLQRALASRLSIERNDPIEPFVWAKLVANAAINPLTALARVRNGMILERPELRARAAAIAREVALVAERSGAALPFADPVAYVEGVARATAENRSSMLTDLEAARRTEIESITGFVVRQAAGLDLEVPENQRVLDEVRALAGA